LTNRNQLVSSHSTVIGQFLTLTFQTNLTPHIVDAAWHEQIRSQVSLW